MLNVLEHTDQQLFRSLYQSAIAMLSRREHSAFELRNKLNQKIKKDQQNSEKIMSRVLKKLIADGYLSDSRYAESYARGCINKGFGYDRINNELIAKGLDVELIADVIGSLKTSEYESEAIKRTWEKKYNRAPKDINEKHKQMRFLHYRGFKFETIQRFISGLVLEEFKS